jgi:uncharacterized protein YdbL (DUF1318 family)
MTEAKSRLAATDPTGVDAMSKTRRSALTLVLALVFALPLSGMAAVPAAWAQSLDDLRAAGKVGERFDGLAVALSGDAKSAVNEVNKKRRQIYEDKAASQGVSTDQVGRVYAQQIFKKAPKGTKFQKEDGSWITK